MPTGTTETENDLLVRACRTTDRFGEVTETVYDARGQVVQTVDPLGRVSHTVYDDNGQAIRTDDAHLSGGSAAGTRTYYDAAGRVVRTERHADVVITLEDGPLWPGAKRTVLQSHGELRFHVSFCFLGLISWGAWGAG